MNPEQVKLAERLWHEGVSTKDISFRVGITERILVYIAAGDRTTFPKRTIRRGTRWYPDTSAAPEPKPFRKIREGVMRWKTEGGAVVTLPMVSMISCPRQGSY